MVAQYQGMRNLVAQSQASVQASVQASQEAMLKQYLGSLQAPAARPPPLAALGAPPAQPSQAVHIEKCVFQPQTPVCGHPENPTGSLGQPDYCL